MLRVLISDFNIVDEMLSGRSVLDFALSVPKDIQLHFAFNKKCELYNNLTGHGFDCTIVAYGTEASRFQRVISFIRAVMSMTHLALRFKPEIIHGNNLMASRVVVIVAKLLRIPSVVQLRNPYVPKRQSWVLELCDRIYCVSNYLKEHVISDNQALKAAVVYDGFCLKNFSEPDYSSKKSSDTVIVGLCSRVAYQKGVHLFCKLARSYAHDSNVIFRHLGGKSSPLLYDEYEADLKSKYIDCVEWINYSNSASEFFESIDVFVLPAVEDEAFGRVIVEAMLSGVPCISTRCGGPEELITNGVSGFLVSADFVALKTVVDKLVYNADLRFELALNAGREARKQFLIEAYRNRIIGNYPGSSKCT